MIGKIYNSICDLLYEVKCLFTHEDEGWNVYVPLEKYNYGYSSPKDEFKDKVSNGDFYIEESYDLKELKVKFTVYKKMHTYDSTYSCGSFDTLNDAREVLKQLKKYKTPIIHYE